MTTAAYHLLLDGIPGDSTAEGHVGAIDVVSFQWSVTSSGGLHGSGGGAGKATFSPLTVQAGTGTAGPPLLLAAASGRHLRSAVLTVDLAAQPRTVQTVRLTDVLVTGLDQSAAGGELPLETVTLAYSTITVTVTVQEPDGSLGTPVTVTWDVEANHSG